MPIPGVVLEPISDGRFPHGEVITVITRTASGKDGAGNVVRGTETSTDYIGAFDPAIGTESATGLEDRVSTQPTAYLPYSASVPSSAVLVIRGDRYEVDGTAAHWRNPFTGFEAGVQVPLRRATG